MICKLCGSPMARDKLGYLRCSADCTNPFRRR